MIIKTLSLILSLSLIFYTVNIFFSFSSILGIFLVLVMIAQVV